MKWQAKVAGWVVLAGGVGVCVGQSPAAPASDKRSDGTCIPGMKDASGKPCPADGAAKKPSAKEQFPYPGSGDPSAADSPDSEAKQKSTVPDAPGASAAKAFPFPSDPERKEGSAGGGSSSSAESSSKESSSNTDVGADATTPKLDDIGSSGKKTRRAPAEKLQTDAEREAEDLKVAKFYVDDGNLNAAYLRAKDAVKEQPDDSEAHFMLAMVAQKMKKRDEAVAEYEAYRKLDPDGLQIKKVKKALEDLK